jgi:glycerol-3-phosphate dehydrogenase
LKVEAPIVDEVFLMLHDAKPVKAALQSLLGRDSKHED